MSPRHASPDSLSPRPPAATGAARAGASPGYTLVEVLVSVAIIAALAALFGGAVSAARSGARVSSTTTAIVRLDQIVATQYRSYAARSVAAADMPSSSDIPNASAGRAWRIRRDMITADMPDRWSDVAYLATTGSSQGFPKSPAQAAYIATWNAASPKPTAQYGGAECLFMIVMQGGFANCLDCRGLTQLKKGDKDNDGAIEFWDEWDNPIDYILWAPGFLKSGDTTKFFDPIDTAFPAAGSVRAGLGLRPLIYSAGADGEYGLNRNSDAATLDRGSSPTGRDCGNPADANASSSGGPNGAAGEQARGDNIVNVELKGAS